MNDIFVIFLSLSLSGSLIALLLFLLKPVIKNRISKTWQYYIFLIVIIRLLLPCGPDTSLMKMVFHQSANYAAAEDNPADTKNADRLLLLLKEASGDQADRNEVTPPSIVKDMKNMLFNWLWLIWIAPAVLLFLRKIAGYFCYIHSVKNGCSAIVHSHTLDIYKDICETMNVKYPPKLIQNKQIASPMLVGIISSYIVLPDTDMIDTNMKYVLQHELTHYKRLDIFYKWLVQIALCIHWFNPLVYFISREVNRNCELSCDETVIRRLDEKSKYAYGDMLLGAIRPDRTVSPFCRITLSEDTKLMKERLSAIMTHKKQPRIMIMLSALLALLLLCGAAASGVYAPDRASQNAGTQGVQTDYAPDRASQHTGTQEVQTDNTQNTQASPISSAEALVTIDEVEMRYYEDTNPDGRWPYVHWLINNNSDKTIIDYEILLLAYDKQGNAMELVWQQSVFTDGVKVTGYTNQSDKSYEQLVASDQPILPGTTEDLNGGWSLFDGWNQADGTHDVANVLACMKKVTFEDGTVWENPEYQDWFSAYKGNNVEPKDIAAY